MQNILMSECKWTFGTISLPRSSLIELSEVIYDSLKSKPFQQRNGHKKLTLIPADEISALFHAISLERWSNAIICATLIDRYTGEFDSSINAIEKLSQKCGTPFGLTHRWRLEGEETVWSCSLSPFGNSTKSNIQWEFSSFEVDPEVGSENWENQWRSVAQAIGASDILVEEKYENLRYPEHRTADRISYLPNSPETRLATSFAPGPPFPVSLSLYFPSNQTAEIIAQFEKLQKDVQKRLGKPTTRELHILLNSQDSESYSEDLGLPRMWTCVDYYPNDDSPKYSAFSAKLAASSTPVALPVYGMTALRNDEEIAVALVNAVHFGSPSREICLEIQTQYGPELLENLAQDCGIEMNIWSGDAECRWGWFD